LNILIAGDWHSELHEEAVFQAFAALGHAVHRFKWNHYLQPRPSRFAALQAASLVSRKFQNKFIYGPRIAHLNRDLIEAGAELKPDLIFIYRGTHVTPDTLMALKTASPATFIVGYNNDDPFGPGQPRSLWRYFLRGLPLYDAVLAYRQQNLADFAAHGARRTRLLRSWFMPERNHPVTLSDVERARFAADVVFVGHYEDDGRLEYLEEVVRQGYRLRLFGPGYDWDPAIARSRWLQALGPVELVWGEDYNKALCGAKVALCFFSRLNRDTYTRRCFEIPAAGTMLLSEYSDDAASLYAAGREADFFRDKTELAAKLARYINDDALRAQLAAGGLRRVWADGHDVISRMRDLLRWIEEIAQPRAATHA
jgi:spore maturation protein CgeB